MEVEQLALSSTPNDECELVARTPDLDEQTIQMIARWVPKRNSLEFGQRQSLSFFEVPGGRHKSFAFVRSVGGPLDTQKQRQIVSYVVLLDEFQFRRFDYHAPNVFHCLRSAGHLTLETKPMAILRKIELPERFRLNLLGGRTKKENIATVQSALAMHDQVASTGVNDPLDLVASVFNQSEVEDRKTLSFSIARRANDESTFRLFVHYKSDADLKREFIQQQIRPLVLDANSA